MGNSVTPTFQKEGIILIRDKQDLDFKGKIQEFMEKLGQGKVIVVVIGEEYLQSENCMFELIRIAQKGDFYNRIFPILLDNAQILL